MSPRSPPLKLEVVRPRLQTIIDVRHTPGSRNSRCGLCRTLNAERRQLAASQR